MADASPWLTSSAPRLDRARLVAAGLFSLGAGITYRLFDRHPPAALWMPVVLLAAAAILFLRASIGAQLLARAIAWSSFTLGFLVTLFGGSSEKPIALAMAGCAGAALLAAGRLGLGDDEASAFKPVAFKRTLMIGMVLAVAVAQALALFGALKMEDHWSHEVAQSTLLFASAAFIALTIVGLYRLRVWGVLLGALTSAGIAALAFSDAYGLKGPLGTGLGVSALVQLALPIPIVVAIFRRKAPAIEPPRKLAALAMPATVLIMLAIAIAHFALRTRPIYYDV